MVDQNSEKKKEFLKRILFILGSLTVVVFFWLIQQGYSRLLAEGEIEKTEALVKKINPELKIEVLDKIAELKQFSVQEVEERLIKQVPASTETPISTSSGSALPEEE
jgi:hypothetical protein